jgi:hypothetical protein
VLGNELLLQEDPQYPGQGAAKYRVASHTVDRVLSAIHSRGLLAPLGWQAEERIDTATAVFVGYLMLDAIVGNTDRHHENWGAISTQDRRLFLAPTFDHASSLGCHITDDERSRRLVTKDVRFTPEAYATRARSALYAIESDFRPLSTVEAFMAGATRSGGAGRAWLEKLSDVSEGTLATIVEGLPPERMSAVAVEFAKRMMLFNRTQLLSRRESL